MHASPGSAAPPRTKTFRTDVQGLRAIAVAAVLVFHAGAPWLPGGFVGVDVFFVISGFLITSHLIGALDRDGRVGLLPFYARRIRRLLPAAFTVLLLTVVAVVVWVPPVLQRTLLQDAAATALYAPNILFAVRGTDYLAETAPSPFQHYWSLGVEEQYYLVWPLLLWGLWRLCAGRRSRLLAGVALLLALSFAASAMLTFTAWQPWAFFSLPTRAWELLAGGAVALGLPWLTRLPRAVAQPLGWAGLLAVIGSMLFVDASTPFPGWAALAPVAGTAAVIAVGSSSEISVVGRLLAARPMQTIGAMSYSLYLVHWPLLVIPALATGDGSVLSGWAAVGALAVSVPAAWALHRFVELRFMASADPVSLRPRLAVALGLAASLVLSGATAATSLFERNADAGVAAVPLSEPEPVPTFSEIVPSNLTPQLSEASDDLPLVYANGCHVNTASPDIPKGCTFGDSDATARVALLGDSHAAQWFPALERLAVDRGFALDSYTKSSCPLVDVPIVTDGVEQVDCAQWRDSVLELVADVRPDVVVLAGFSRYSAYGTSSVDVQSWNHGLAAVLERLPETTRVVVIADTPEFESTPANCLSARVADALACARPVEDAVDAEWVEAERLTAEAGGADYVDMTDVLCNDVCGVVIANQLMYRDRHHLSASASEWLAPVLGERIALPVAPVASRADDPRWEG